jgi:hypothetical protein
MANVANVKGSPNLYGYLARLSINNPSISAIVCQNQGPTVVGPMGPYANRTNIQAISTRASTSLGNSSATQTIIILAGNVHSCTSIDVSRHLFFCAI